MAELKLDDLKKVVTSAGVTGDAEIERLAKILHESPFKHMWETGVGNEGALLTRVRGMVTHYQTTPNTTLGATPFEQGIRTVAREGLLDTHIHSIADATKSTPIIVENAKLYDAVTALTAGKAEHARLAAQFDLIKGAADGKALIKAARDAKPVSLEAEVIQLINDHGGGVTTHTAADIEKLTADHLTPLKKGVEGKRADALTKLIDLKPLETARDSALKAVQDASKDHKAIIPETTASHVDRAVATSAGKDIAAAKDGVGFFTNLLHDSEKVKANAGKAVVFGEKSTVHMGKAAGVAALAALGLYWLTSGKGEQQAHRGA